MRLSQRPTDVRMLLQALTMGTISFLLTLPAIQPGKLATLMQISPLESLNPLDQLPSLAPLTSWGSAVAVAIAVAVLWRLPTIRWTTYLLVLFAITLVTGSLRSIPLRGDLGFSVLSVCEVALCAWLGRTYVDGTGALSTTRSLLHFLLLLPIGVGALAGVAGATLANRSVCSQWWLAWLSFTVNNGVALLVVVPGVLAWTGKEGAASINRKIGRLIAFGGGSAAALVIFGGHALHSPDAVQRVALALVLTASAVYGGLRSASVALAVAAVLGTLVAYESQGELAAWQLQANLAGFALLSYFVAAAVSERAQLRLRLEKARRMESLGLLVGGVAHDFRNILGAIQGYAEMAEERLPARSAALPQMLQLRSATVRGLNLTEQMLLVARKGGNGEHRVVDLLSIVQEAIELVKPLCRPGVELVLEQTVELLLVRGNHDQLLRAVLNIIRNACQAARRRVTVRVDAGTMLADAIAVGDLPSGLAVWVEVEDDGDGISEEDQAYLFEPFFSKGKSRGAGLGLAIVAGIACEHGGGVSVSSGLGRTRFRLLLPGATGTGKDDGYKLGNGEKVLLIGQNGGGKMQMTEWLADLGFHPLAYDEPEQALNRASFVPNDVCFLVVDIDTATADRAEYAMMIKQRASEIPVILCSDDPYISVIATAARSTALPKPYDRDVFTDVVTRVKGKSWT